MFTENKAIAGAGDRTVSSLIPALIKTTICGNGTLLLRSDPDVSRAIVDGVILASSDEVGAVKNIRDIEPLVYNGLMNFLSQMSIDRILNLALNQINKESGATAEEMFSYWIALTTYSHIREGSGSRKGVLLGDLLYPLYDGTDRTQFPHTLFNEYVCDSTKVVDLENKGFFASLNIVQNDDSYVESMNTETVYFGIDTSCGVDIVFVVKNQRDNHHKLVAIQSKNDKAITVKEVLMTLSPGLQYLEMPYREFVITGNFPKNKKTPARRSCGPGFPKWDEWKKFCSTYDSSVGNNW
eukprot:CAMPEP_0185044218 /NCGR_PEP_ID=MMETSP1103-20130426/43328_1 /TAXON_ID=36769 /ORGANISM="Paraphysomonas bandaiensis, Strain Caron Lab Isolate" /LENGTH=295 /DNA_ID=CAMNT_0027584459 /DNA_START=901 /DNA_END=1785 /DNA_ORIENTATION=-